LYLLTNMWLSLSILGLCSAVL